MFSIQQSFQINLNGLGKNVVSQVNGKGVEQKASNHLNLLIINKLNFQEKNE